MICLHGGSHRSVEDQYLLLDDFFQRRTLHRERLRLRCSSAPHTRAHSQSRTTLAQLAFAHFGNDPLCLFHFLLVVEVHLQMNAFCADGFEQRPEFRQGDPRDQHALAACQNLAIQIVPLGRTSLRFAHTRRPLDGFQLLNLEQGRQVVQGTDAIQMIEGIGNTFALLPDKRLYETAIIRFRQHRRKVALQLGHLARCPRREIAESHFPVFLLDNVIQFVEHLEVCVVDALHLLLQHLRLFHDVHHNLVGSLHPRQHVDAFHQVGHTHVIMALRFLLAGPQQVFVQPVVGMFRIEPEIVCIVRIRMNPDGVVSRFKPGTQDGRHRTRAQLRVGHGKHIGFQARVPHIPIQIVCTPSGIEPFLLIAGWHRGAGNHAAGSETGCSRLFHRSFTAVGTVRTDAHLKMFPHIQHDALMVPPIDVVLLGFFQIFFPSVHECQVSSYIVHGCKYRDYFRIKCGYC